MKNISMNYKRFNCSIFSENKLFVCIAFVIAILMAFGSYSFAATGTLKDIQGHWAQPSIESAYDAGFINGYTDSTFRPDTPVTRAEFVSMMNKAFDVPASATQSIFIDIKSNDWFAANVWAAANASYVEGYPDNTFRPNNYISREQSATIVFNLTKISGGTYKSFGDSSQIAKWSKVAVSSLASAGILSGYSDGSFCPGKSITRAEAVVIINKAKNYLSSSSGDITGTQQNITTTPVKLSLTVTAGIVNIRTNPGTTYTVIGQVKAGDVLGATELSSNNWYKVKFGDTTGWIIGQFVQETAEVSRGGTDPAGSGSNTGVPNPYGVKNFVWIWQLSKSEGGNIDALIQKAKDLNIGYVIKTHDGYSYWQEQADAITKLNAAGVTVGAWGYCYGNHVDDEINNVKKSFDAGASFYVADVESEYENVNMRDKAEQFMSAISKFGPIDYTSYAYPTYHSSVPFDIFNKYARYAIPQSYWGYIGDTPQESFDKSVREYKETGAQNIAPMGMICNNVPVDEIKQFLKLCENYGSQPIFWWDYQEASSDMLNALAPDSSAK